MFRARNASQEPAAEGVTEAMELNEESHQEDPDQKASHQVDPVVNVAGANNSMQNASTALPESVLPAAEANDKSADIDTSQAVKATSLGDLAEPMETDAK